MKNDSENEFDSDLQKLLQKYMPNNKDIFFSFGGNKNKGPLHKALDHASKRHTGKKGSLDIVYPLNSKRHGNFLVIIETKTDKAQKINGNPNNPKMDKESTANYAVNGILWYAKHIYQANHSFDRIFALGIVGNIKNFSIAPYYVYRGNFQTTPSVTSLKTFTTNHIDNYFGVSINDEKSRVQKDRDKLRKQANDLNNDIRSLTAINPN